MERHAGDSVLRDLTSRQRGRLEDQQNRSINDANLTARQGALPTAFSSHRVVYSLSFWCCWRGVFDECLSLIDDWVSAFQLAGWLGSCMAHKTPLLCA